MSATADEDDEAAYSAAGDASEGSLVSVSAESVAVYDEASAGTGVSSGEGGGDVGSCGVVSVKGVCCYADVWGSGVARAVG